MVQMNQTNPETKPMLANPALGRVLALGLRPTPKQPKITVKVDDMTITLQPDGQIALFTENGLFACECKGSPVEALPATAIKRAGLREELKAVSIWQDGKLFYTKRKAKVTALKIYDYTSPYDQAVAEIDDDSPELCGLFHTDDESIDDDDYDDNPLPTYLPDED